jgi:hypothetical protein
MSTSLYVTFWVRPSSMTRRAGAALTLDLTSPIILITKCLARIRPQLRAVKASRRPRRLFSPARRGLMFTDNPSHAEQETSGPSRDHMASGCPDPWIPSCRPQEEFLPVWELFDIAVCLFSSCNTRSRDSHKISSIYSPTRQQTETDTAPSTRAVSAVYFQSRPTAPNRPP